MANRLLIWLHTMPGWVDPQDTRYRLLTGTPERVGDEALIKVGQRRVRVMLHESRGVDGRTYQWLVER